jgi:hypothetical protein
VVVVIVGVDQGVAVAVAAGPVVVDVCLLARP